MDPASLDPVLLARLTQPFFDQGESVVYLAQCCDRLAVSVLLPEKARCSQCQREVRYTALPALRS
jgi:hypothetical protein